MRADFAEPCAYTYVPVDERCQPVAVPYDQRPGPRAACGGALIALPLAAGLLGPGAGTRFLAYARRDHRALFPLLPGRSRYNWRRRHRSRAPIASAGGRRADGGHRRRSEADPGRIPSKEQL